MEGKQGMTADQRPTGPERVRRLQTMLHANAREEPGRRFPALADKVQRSALACDAGASWIARGGGMIVA